MIKIDDKEYKIVLFDTNAISNIVKNYKNSMKNFHRIVKNEGLLSIVTMQNIIELRKSKDTYEKFLALFSLIPIHVFSHYRTILNNNNVDIKEFIIGFEKKGYFYNIKEKIEKELFENPENITNINIENEEVKKLCKIWNEQKKDKTIFKDYTKIKYINNIEKNTAINALNNTFGINSNKYEEYAGVRLLCYTMFDRIFKTNNVIEENDIRDALISLYVPYVDIFYTEKHQFEVIKQAKTFIKELKNVEIHKVSELYGLGGKSNV